MKTITPQQWATLKVDSAVIINSQHQLNQLDTLIKKDISNWGSYHGFPFVIYRRKDTTLSYSNMGYYKNNILSYNDFQPVKIIYKLLKTKEYSNGKN